MISVHAFIDIDHPVVAWAAYRGVLVSANAEYTPPECPISIMFAGIIHSQNNTRLKNELKIELIRQLQFPHCISRLTGMYFFENKLNCESAYEWGGHFSPEYLVELELHPTAPVSRHDANWITYSTLDKNGIINDEDWIIKYWSGEPFPDEEPVWELIAQGRAVICGTELREKAYKNIISDFPKSVAMLEVSRIAGHVGSDLGNSLAWIIRKDEHSLELSFYLDMRDAKDEKFLEKVRLYDGPRNYADLSTVDGDTFCMPDFREFSCLFTLGEGISDDALYSVHKNIAL